MSFVMPVRMDQPGFHMMDFNDVRYLRIIRKSVEKIQLSLTSGKNNGHFTRKTMYIYDNILLNYT
jgi:hypothetical protein